MTDNKIFWLIDDDADDRMLFARAVKRIGRNVSYESIETAEEAISMLENNDTRLPDVVFLDINMPRMGGWECLSRIKADERTKNIPVIMYSTSERASDIKLAEELGALSFCVKPEEMPDLQQMLTTVYDNLGPALQSKLCNGDLKCMRY